MTAPVVSISVYNSARRVISRWNTRQCRSVQSIMGATQNRCDNILMLFRFIISSGIADFLGRQKFRADYWGVFLSFQGRKSITCGRSMIPRLLQYSIAVPNELMQYRG